MSRQEAEERALEVMRKELASERMPDLPWDDMERELMARLDDAPMTSHPRSLDARVEDVPVSSVRNPRTRFVQISFAVFAAAATFLLLWMSPLHSGKPIVISSATPSVPVPEVSTAEITAPVPLPSETNSPTIQPSASAAIVEPTRTIVSKDVKTAFKKCAVHDKHYGKGVAKKLKGEKLVVFLEPDGSVATIRFDSPIEPKTMECTFDLLRSGRFVGATSPVTIQF